MNIDSYKILIVDDVDENIKLAAKILRVKNYNISYARSGKEALSKISKINFDLILLDIMMPEMDGYETAIKIKQVNNYKEVPIIFITAKNDIDDIVKGFDVGGVDYITKPFNSQELLARVKTHIKLFKTEKQLRNTIVAKDKMLSVISHDLLGPLGMIKMSSDMFLKGEFRFAKENVKEFISNIQNSIDSSYSMISNVLDWARNTHNLENIKLESINVLDEINEVEKVFSQNLSERNISFKVNILSDLEIKYDKDIFKMIIRNLLSNAIKFTDNNGIIKLYTENKENNKLYFCIEDNGIGMSKEIVNNLKKQNGFYTSNGINNEKGHGLGLNIVKDFIRIMGGELIIESEVDKGSVFKFSTE
jgi:signal transduction histidine kinase